MSLNHDDPDTHETQHSSRKTEHSWLSRAIALVMSPLTIIIGGLGQAIEKTIGMLFWLAIIAGIAHYSFDTINVGTEWLFGTDRAPRAKIMGQPDAVQEYVQQRHEMIDPAMVAQEYAKTDGFHLVLQVSQDSDDPQQGHQQESRPHTIAMTLNPLASPDDEPNPHEVSEKQRAHAKLNAIMRTQIKETITKNHRRHQDRLARLLYRIEERAEQDIWNHAIKVTPWFVNQFYHLRADEHRMKEKMREFLIPPDHELHRYHSYVIYDMIECIETMLAEILRDSISGAQVRLREADLHLRQEELVRKLQELLPTPNEMIQSMHRGLEAEGLNHQYQSMILENWRMFELEHPGTSLTYKSFMILSVLALRSSPLIVVGATAMYLISVGEAVSFYQERSQYEKTLLSEIYRVKKAYHGQTEHFVTSVFQGILLYLQGKAKPSFTPHIDAERIPMLQTTE